MAAAVRDRLLDAGADALAELTPADLVTAVGTREVARRAGVSTSAFFRQFPTVADFADALVAHVYSHRALPPIVENRHAVEGLGTSDLPTVEGLAFHVNDIRRMRADPTFRVRIGLWALGGPTVDAIYGRFLAEREDFVAASIEATFRDVWGREVMPPFDIPAFIGATVSLLQGATIRWITDPERMTPEQYGRLALSFGLSLTRRLGERLTVDDALAQMNWFPSESRREQERASKGSRAAGVRERLLLAAGDHFRKHGYDDARVSAIARAAGVHVDTLHAHFGSKADLAIALFLARLDDVAATSLREHLVEVARRSGPVLDLARQYQVALTVGAEDDLVASTAALMEGDVAAARVLLLTVLGVVVASPSVAPEDAVDRAEALLSRGAEALRS